VSCEGIVSNPNLQPLGDNGGPTQTQALGLGSVAIDYGYGPACSATDQRGVGRPQLAGCDVGAYEVAPPSVTTGPAGSVTTGAASLGGSVNPNQRASSYHFEYGVTDSYGSSTATKNLAAGNAPVGVSADLGGLTPSTTYHYRVVASNADGSSTGADQTFTTGAAGGGSGDDSTPPAPTGSSDPTGTDPTGPSTSTTTTTATTDRVAPTLRSVTFVPLKLRKSATLKFSLSEPAKVAIVIKRGKKVVARIAMSGKSGANRRKVARKIGRRTLKVGRYVLALQATDPAGNRSSLKQIKFRVVR
jgi:hypothetical protein